MKKNKVNIIGGGLAGCEAALYLEKLGMESVIFEMRPKHNTPAHKSGNLAELICSNSLKSKRIDTGAGLLKAEMKMLGSPLIDAAESFDIKSGAALTVDRELFSSEITKRIEKSTMIKLIREEVTDIHSLQKPVIIASGPLTSAGLSNSIKSIIGKDFLYFYDAISPIISRDSINENRGFFESRYGKGDENIFNLPMSKEEYLRFYEELIKAEIVDMKEPDKMIYFESCLPVEEIAARGEKSLLFGPLKPVGFSNEKARNAEAVLQLRPENKDMSSYNLIGFQTRLKYPEQKRVFRMIPGLEDAEFLRFGSMHRNTYINSPAALKENLSLKTEEGIFFAGQISGVEGYIESIMSGLINAIAVYNYLKKDRIPLPPSETMTGSIIRKLIMFTENFQPVNANFGILPETISRVRDKKAKRKMQAEIALRAMENWVNAIKF
ncbi:MAG TPA: methylenetetrahydrofolate--tRNA-(uracil(54)-C(5))-methyltransferase (FADH(2)-oxidizing) TrmFO [Firmicutes bacterium]|nr:methylenetetrahydrofolate--tRNA-(uracil(54)-C(5))-methyltransferase (FADH(2)-oxidizing) TrmFO [Bacillota bacterium]